MIISSRELQIKVIQYPKVMNIKQHTLGFTLIELLVTIVVIGILASMSIAIMTDYKRKANNVKALAALEEIRKAGEIICNDYELNYRDNLALMGGGVVRCRFGTTQLAGAMSCEGGANVVLPFISAEVQNSDTMYSQIIFPGLAGAGNPDCSYTGRAHPCDGDEYYYFLQNDPTTVTVKRSENAAAWSSALNCGNYN